MLLTSLFSGLPVEMFIIPQAASVSWLVVGSTRSLTITSAMKSSVIKT